MWLYSVYEGAVVVVLEENSSSWHEATQLQIICATKLKVIDLPLAGSPNPYPNQSGSLKGHFTQINNNKVPSHFRVSGVTFCFSEVREVRHKLITGQQMENTYLYC